MDIISSPYRICSMTILFNFLLGIAATLPPRPVADLDDPPSTRHSPVFKNFILMANLFSSRSFFSIQTS